MAMSMKELFYGAREPVTFVHYARQSPIPYSYDHQPFPELHGSRRPIANTFDLMVPMCSTRCVDQVREALLHLGGIHDVAFDPYEQRVTVTGYVDPVKALKQVKGSKGELHFGPKDPIPVTDIKLLRCSSHTVPNMTAEITDRIPANLIDPTVLHTFGITVEDTKTVLPHIM